MVVLARLALSPDEIRGNLVAVLADLKKSKPASAKGVYVRKVTLSTTMGPGVTYRSQRDRILRMFESRHKGTCCQRSVRSQCYREGWMKRRNGFVHFGSLCREVWDTPR